MATALRKNRIPGPVLGLLLVTYVPFISLGLPQMAGLL